MGLLIRIVDSPNLVVFGVLLDDGPAVAELVEQVDVQRFDEAATVVPDRVVGRVQLQRLPGK
jgi:hypothetical protein